MSQPSKEFKELNIPALASAAEHGDGCPTRWAIDDLGFEERFKALKLIQEQSVKDNSEDPSLPKLETWSRSGSSRIAENKFYLNLKIVRGNAFLNYLSDPNQIYADVLSAYTGIHSSSCWNKPDKP